MLGLTSNLVPVGVGFAVQEMWEDFRWVSIWMENSQLNYPNVFGCF